MTLNFRDLRAEDVECRVDMVRENGVSLLLYKNARCDMSILDETVGPLNWMRQHSRDNANCTLSIWDSEKGQWISKEDTGTESRSEKEKGLASDSFKRAAFNWGIGRELYTAPFIWIPSSKVSLVQEAGKWKTKDRFEVASIETQKKRITALQIVNAESQETVYSYKIKKAPDADFALQYCQANGLDVKRVCEAYKIAELKELSRKQLAALTSTTNLELFKERCGVPS